MYLTISTTHSPATAACNLLRAAAQVAVGDAVAIQLHRGRPTTEVKTKEPS